MKKFNAVVKARTMEFIRDRGTLIWNLVFPILLVFGFAFAFGGNDQAMFKVGVIAPIPGDMAFFDIEGIETVLYGPGTDGGPLATDEVLERLRSHQLDMVVDPAGNAFYLNSESSKSDVLRRLFLGASRGFEEQAVSGEAIRYVDWFVPGVIGMNMMFSCLFGVGFVIVRYRKNGVLKRLKATPVSALSFVSAQAVSRLVIVAITSVFVFAGTNLVLGFMMKGSYLDLFLITVAAILCMLAIGLVFASRIRSEELASGLINLVTLPMMLLSGIFFSLEGSPRVLQNLSKIFPLTHFVEGARSIMLEGAGLVDILPNLAVLLGLTVVFLGLSSALFRWE
jgi:ABC-2 type transport system permease protein